MKAVILWFSPAPKSKCVFMRGERDRCAIVEGVARQPISVIRVEVLSMLHDLLPGEDLVIERPVRQSANAEEPVVFVVDDDESMREALRSLFRSVSLRVETFGSAADFLRSKLPDVASCLVLDIRLPGLSGLDFQGELAKANINIPIIFMTGHGDIPMSVQAMKAGAVDFLTKPFRDHDLLDDVASALERDRNRRKEEQRLTDLRARSEKLTTAQRQVSR